ncbi:hypothetical protein AVEN_248323-1 [Araneus ventricosus]|uniref:Uncharacterized protein n=1 Tax=Araneus ventricosus TaxID=182803 RepID=A0A4Y2QTT2_ARAVE|nr:hypothetical protein AVEN_248323-1 [Araneus ventricosus]
MSRPRWPSGKVSALGPGSKPDSTVDPSCVGTGIRKQRLKVRRKRTPCPQLVSVPLTGLERMLSSSFNMGLSLPTSKDFTCLTTIIAVVVELAIYTVSWHMRKPAPNFEQERLKRVANNLVSRQKIRGIIKFISENRDIFRPP